MFHVKQRKEKYYEKINTIRIGNIKRSRGYSF